MVTPFFYRLAWKINNVLNRWKIFYPNSVQDSNISLFEHLDGPTPKVVFGKGFLNAGLVLSPYTFRNHLTLKCWIKNQQFFTFRCRREIALLTNYREMKLDGETTTTKLYVNNIKTSPCALFSILKYFHWAVHLTWRSSPAVCEHQGRPTSATAATDARLNLGNVWCQVQTGRIRVTLQSNRAQRELWPLL